MSFFIKGQEIKDEFDLYCMGYDIDGALRVMMRRIYLEAGEDLGAVEGALFQMGHEAVKKETFEHVLSTLGERETIVKISPNSDRRLLAKRNAEAIRRALLFGIKSIHEGD